MNTDVKRLFDLQTEILSINALLRLMQLFIGEKQTCYLYSTIIPTKEVTKRELIAAGKPVTDTFNYTVNVTINRPIVSFTLKSEGFTPIEFYHVTLRQQKPTVDFLKTVVKVIIKTCRPIPSKIDIRLHNIAKKHRAFFDYHECYSAWNTGSFRYLPTKESTPDFDKVGKSIISAISEIKVEFQVFSKLLIDIYNGAKLLNYINEEKTFELISTIAKNKGICLILKCIFEDQKTHKVIPITQFHPTNPELKENPIFFSDMMSCVIPYITNK